MLDLKQHKERFYHHKVSISAQPVSPVEHLASHLPIIEIDTLDGKVIPLERGEMKVEQDNNLYEELFGCTIN